MTNLKQIDYTAVYNNAHADWTKYNSGRAADDCARVGRMADRAVEEAQRENASAEKIDGLKVGDGVSMSQYSDVHAGTIIKRTPTTIFVQRDTATLNKEKSNLHTTPGGFVGHTTGTQVWDHEADPDGGVSVYTRRITKCGKHLRWIKKGTKTFGNGSQLHAGRHEHYDYNF